MNKISNQLLEIAKEILSAKKTKEQYENIFNGKFHGKLTFIDVIFPNNRATILYDCPKHPLSNNQHRKMRVDSINKSGCKQCDMQRRRTTQQEFIQKAKQLHKDENGKPLYDYSKTQYVKADKQVVIICPRHGEFKQLPYHHNNSNHPSGCPECGKDNSQFGRRLY